MSNIGSGGGTSYPSALDTQTSQEVNAPNAGKTKARAEVANDLAAIVIAIETILGTDPAGILADVKTFLQTEHGVDGTHDPAIIVKTSGNQTIAGVKTYSDQQIWSKGADVVSATTLALGTDGNFFDITGTTTITGIQSKGVGIVVRLQFDDALTLTHDANNLILPNGENIITVAGDVYEFVEYASADWICTGFNRVGTSLITDNAITTDKIVDEAVTGLKNDRSSFSLMHECIENAEGVFSAINGAGTIQDESGGVLGFTGSSLYQSTAQKIFDIDNGTVTGVFRAKSTSDDGIAICGFTDTQDMSANANGVYFDYNSATNKIEAVTRLASSETSTDTDIDWGGSWKELKIVATSSQVLFYIDDTLKATHATNIPAAILYGGFGRSTGAGNDVFFDYGFFHQSAR